MKDVSENSTASKGAVITKNWLAGFTEGEASFSTNKLAPRLKF